MLITSATFSDPLLRPGLQAYYDKTKDDLYEALKARDASALPETVIFRDGQGVEHTAKLIPLTAEKMRDALVPFDTWLELQARTYDTQTDLVRHAQQAVVHLEQAPFAQEPDKLAAREQLAAVTEVHQRWQMAMHEIQSYLLSMQEVADA